MKGLIPYVIAAVAIASVAIAQQPPAPDVLEPAPQLESSDSPKRLTVQVSVADPEDLKVKMGDRVEAGQLIADRSRERQRLEAQQQQLTLTVQKLETSTISPPLPPAAAPAILEPTYLEENAAIEKAQATVEQAESAIALKQQEIAYLTQLASLDPLVMEHEQVKLAELKQTHAAAVRDYQLAVGKRRTAEYRYSVVSAQAVGSLNRDALEYQQQWANYEQWLRDKDYQLSQTQLRLNEVENAIALRVFFNITRGQLS